MAYTLPHHSQTIHRSNCPFSSPRLSQIFVRSYLQNTLQRTRHYMNHLVLVRPPLKKSIPPQNLVHQHVNAYTLLPSLLLQHSIPFLTDSESPRHSFLPPLIAQIQEDTTTSICALSLKIKLSQKEIRKL